MSAQLKGTSIGSPTMLKFHELNSFVVLVIAIVDLHPENSTHYKHINDIPWNEVCIYPTPPAKGMWTGLLISEAGHFIRRLPHLV